MKKILGILALSAFVGTGAFAQTVPAAPDLKSLGSAFDHFSSDVASSLPFASTMGLNWSWAYIGKLPHFGVGLSLGTVFLPTDGFDAVTKAVNIPGVSLTSQLNNPYLGLPLPAYTAEARLGGIILPFDIGIKAGLIPPQLQTEADRTIDSALHTTGASLGFQLYGASLRYELVKEKFLIPEISIGVGLNHFQGHIDMPVGQSIKSPITDPNNKATYYINVSQPTLGFNWNSTSFDANIQMSKKILLLVTPYIGAGLSYGRSNSGGGISAPDLTVTDSNGNVVTGTELASLESALALTGQTVDLTSSGLQFGSNVNGFSARAFGGVSLNLWFLKLDVTGMYNVMSGKLGATVGARAQF
jgi:hypothetical protein